MSESIFLEQAGGFMPTAHASGPWDPQALHGGAAAALITGALERVEPGSELPIARLSFELLRPVPYQPLTLATRVIREGRRVQELACEMHAGDRLICRAGALRVQPIAADVPAPPPPPGDRDMPGPQAGAAVRFALDNPDRDSFAASAMEMRWLDDHRAPGPGRVWMRLRHPVVPGEQPSPLARLAASADFGNGVGHALPFDEFLFINADLSVHLHRLPRGEWIGLDARTVLTPGGTGLAESVLHDTEGPVGRAFQSLVVSRR